MVVRQKDKLIDGIEYTSLSKPRLHMFENSILHINGSQKGRSRNKLEGKLALLATVCWNPAKVELCVILKSFPGDFNTFSSFMKKKKCLLIKVPSQKAFGKEGRD